MDEQTNKIEGDILALKQLLSASDYKALKYSEGLLTEEEYAETKIYRQQLRFKINQLESELGR